MRNLDIPGIWLLFMVYFRMYQLYIHVPLSKLWLMMEKYLAVVGRHM